MAASFSLNDGVLLLSLLYSVSDIMVEWESFKSCGAPIQWWLLISYLLMVAFRVAHNLGRQHAAENEHFLLNLRQQKALPRILMQLTWSLFLPAFAVWTFMGSFWLREVLLYTPECLPMGAHPWFIIFWQFLSYLWIIVHAMFGLIAMVLERRIRRAEDNVRQIEDDDVLQRWGRMSNFGSYGALPWMQNAGLQPSDIDQLEMIYHQGDPVDCSICLTDVEEKDAVRVLPGCKHTFHKACIDLWLLRRADCPLCKCQVKMSDLADTSA